MSFRPIHFALTLPKGFAKEYKDRDWFNSIYFSKLSMSQEQEGYTPILYNFTLKSEASYDLPVPERLLMTFYYPEKRMSNLNGLIMIGGQPDIYQSYQITKTITPYLESLTLDEHGIGHDATISVIEETLNQLANPTSLRSTHEIIERSQGKTGDDLSTFYPILTDPEYEQDKLSLPMDFAIDAVFMFKIDPSFFSSTEIGAGLLSLRLYGMPEMNTKPYLAFPLIFKWQPIYNDILNTIKQARGVLPDGYEGRLVPSTIVFDREGNQQKTALISAIGEFEGQLYYHVAVANSGADDGQPLSLLQSQLSREKFGQPDWVTKLDKLKSIPEDSIRQEMDEAQIAAQLLLKVPETEVTVDGRFDLGKLRSIELLDAE